MLWHLFSGVKELFLKTERGPRRIYMLCIDLHSTGLVAKSITYSLCY